MFLHGQRRTRLDIRDFLLGFMVNLSPIFTGILISSLLGTCVLGISGA